MVLSRFYPIIDIQAVAGRAAETAQLLAAAGCDLLQVRAKNATSDRYYAFAKEIVEAVGPGCRVIVNDRFDIALAAGASGVHLGEHDPPLEAIRPLAPPGFILGATCREPASAGKAEMEGADYIGAGAVFPTGSKGDTRLIGLEGLAAIARAVRIPVYGIAGISLDNCAAVVAAGAWGCAGISAVAGEDPAAAFRRLETALAAAANIKP